ncbi:MAG: PEP/pyruvate-binding domain-containing protein [Caldilineaceae bacterium]
MSNTYLLDPTTTPDLALLGGKARALAALANADLPIPAWFALSPEAFTASLSPEQRGRLADVHDSGAALAVLADVRIQPELENALTAAVAQLCPPGAHLAVRSSAVDEDAAQHSFAGQLESFLQVAPADVPAKVLAVWRSAFQARVYTYRREHGLPLPPCAPAVLIQRMVQAETAGVAFSADPVSGRRNVTVVTAVRGLGEQLVAGEANADSYQVTRQGTIVTRQLSTPLQPVLTDTQVRAVAALACQCERWFGRPQDVEWAIEGGELYLLQSRPITSLATLADPNGVQNLWDNSNIVESYGGVTTPLTYSFARRAYEAVYQEFCRILGVPNGIIRANQSVFACMIGLVRGRIYYNLLNWYRVLAMLPGYKTNRPFLEQMLGVKESLPEQVAVTLGQRSWQQNLIDRLYLGRAVFRLLVNLLLLARCKRYFYQRLQQALGAQRPDLTALRPDELVTYYRTLDQQLLTRWDAPLLNDFFAMIFYGVLRKLAVAWCGDTAGTLQNDLLTGEGGMISAEPALRVQTLAQLAAGDDALVALLRTGTLHELHAALADRPAFAQQVQAYLDKFGDRCADELKLESPTLHANPLPLMRSIGQLAGRHTGQQTPLNYQGSAGKPAQRVQAEQQVRVALAGKPLRRLLFNWVLTQARKSVCDRENLRFERTRVFGRARQIFTELGQRFYALDLLDEAHDVFYLEAEEILGFVEGTATCTDLRGLAAVRKAEFARFAQMPPPAERFTTVGMVHQGNQFQAASRPHLPLTSGEELQGIGSCPGLVRGRARVVTNPATAHLEPGDILVAERTDPSWIMIMPAAAGLLVERGSLLSHAAIVSRELGLPAIVSLTGITHWLADGDLVEFDGSTGIVRKVTG